MASLAFIYLLFIFIFALVGAVRGWAKELLVTFSVILALFIIAILTQYVPYAKGFLSQQGVLQFWVKVLLFISLVIFGYQTPNLPYLRGGGDRFQRQKIQDTLLGMFFGALNGYLIAGTIWYYLDQAGYPFPFLSAPDESMPLGDLALSFIRSLPPTWISGPLLYALFAIFAAFILVLLV